MIDPNGRTVDYLRISVTDRCNERCLYCMPENYSAWLPRGDILSYEEILAVARAGARLGFRRYRVTGGEPLVRPGIVEFIAELKRIPGVETVASLDKWDAASGAGGAAFRGGAAAREYQP